MFTEDDDFPGADTMNAGAIGNGTFLSNGRGCVDCRKIGWGWMLEE
jgi:hypothetical protein